MAHSLTDKQFFDKAFDNRNGIAPPADLRRAAERIVKAFGIRGSADPMYIVNVIAVETGRGDGQGNFKEVIA